MSYLFTKQNKYYILLFIGFLVYSISGILSKLASNEQLFSFKYCLLYFGIILVLGIYALIWQQVLKYFDLSTAMSFKPIVLILNCLWAILIFDEKLDIRTICGVILIMFGIFIIGVYNE